MGLLDKLGASDSGMTMWPSANFYHPSSRKLPSSVLNQACSCDVFHGSHSGKEHGNKAAVRAVGAGPLMRAACLASLSDFQFPEQLYLPFGAIGNV
jgi:hypothetical protein